MAEIIMKDVIGDASVTIVLDDSNMQFVRAEVKNETKQKLEIVILDKTTQSKVVSEQWAAESTSNYDIPSKSRPTYSVKTIDKIDRKVTFYQLSHGIRMVLI